MTAPIFPTYYTPGGIAILATCLIIVQAVCRAIKGSRKQ